MRSRLTIPVLLSLVLVGCAGGTDPATDVTNVSATLNAHGHTTGQPATWWWEYAKSKADLGGPNDTEVCGREADHRCGPGSSGSNDVQLHVSVTGLTPNTTYWFRACGQDEGGAPVCAQALSFKTLAGTKYAFERSFDRYRAYEVAVDRDGFLWLLGPGRGTGGRHSAGGKLTPTGEGVIPAWALDGADGALAGPHGIAVDADSNVYIADNGQWIKKFDRAVTFVAKWGGLGSGPGQFNMPNAVATDVLGNVYVVDTGNNRIQKFTPQGTFIRAWGSQGSGQGQFQSPQGIAIDPDGNVYVTDVGNGRVQRFDVQGHYLSQFAWSGAWIAADSAGSVYVSDDPNDRVLKLSPTGQLLAAMSSAAGGPAMVRPLGVATDSLGNVYVADPDCCPIPDDFGAVLKYRPVE